MSVQILFPASFTEEHRAVVLRYLEAGATFSGPEWATLLEAFDRLKGAVVVPSQGPAASFPKVYREQIDERYASEFIDRLYTLNDVARESGPCWAEVARKIPGILSQEGFVDRQVPETRFLLAYALYWWQSFAKGYAFQVEILRDLERSGLRFQAADLHWPEGRFAPYDLEILGYRGDIKTSTYFLQVVRSSTVPHDFYITALLGWPRRRLLVVFLQPAVWNELNGDTQLTNLQGLAMVLPQPARIEHRGRTLVVVDYELWKERVKQHQSEKESENG